MSAAIKALLEKQLGKSLGGQVRPFPTCPEFGANKAKAAGFAELSLGPETADDTHTVQAQQESLGTALPPLSAVKGEADKAKRNDDTKAMRDAVAGVEVFADQHGEARLRVGSEAVPVESTQGLNHLRLMVFEATNKAPSDDLVRREVGLLAAKAQLEGTRRTVHKRVGKTDDGTVVIDRGSKGCIHVEPGHWEGREHGDELFTRGPGFGEMPEPIRPESPKAALWVVTDVLAEMGVPENRRLILSVAPANAFRPSVPYPVILVVGGAGSGKTTAAGHLGALVDPTSSGELPNVPLNAQDIAAVGSEHHVLGLDNLSSITPAQSDLLCTVATGTEIVLRQFHERKETVRLKVHCPLILTAITNVVTRGDLLDRLIPIALEPQTDYKGADEVRAWFREVQPKALGALVELLAAGLALLPEVKRQRRWTHRLVDFCQLGEAIVQACGEAPGTFLRDFEALRREAAEEAASGDPVIQHVLEVVRGMAGSAEASENFPPWRRWSGAGWYAIKHGEQVSVAIKAGTLRDKVRTVALVAQGRGWIPESDKQMADVLLTKKPTLAAIGITVEHRLFNGNTGGAWVISWAD